MIANAPGRPTVFCLHFLGGSAREWDRVRRLLAGRLDLVAIDLPGFGDAAHVPGYSVAEMAAHVLRAVRDAAPQRWMLAGHSMGAKVAVAIARDAADGAPDTVGLVGLVLVAGSPPSPEPMDESQRQTMLGWFAGDANARREQARRYIGNNSVSLDDAATELAVDDVLRANRAAWVAWLERGTREDWSQRVGVLTIPTLVIAGGEDEQLGPSAQRQAMLPHFAHARLVTLAGAKHLLPLERTDDVARAIVEHVDDVERSVTRAVRRAAYDELIASNRVSSVTRGVLREREKPDDPQYVPAALDATAYAVLRAVVDRVIPQSGTMPIDLAARIDAQLATGTGDGWRPAALPPDPQAYAAGLNALDALARAAHGNAFVALDASAKDALLEDVADGNTAAIDPKAPLDASQLKAWFEDLRADAVKHYMLHPDTLARIGYSGIAYGGDGEPKTGFARIGYGERDAWEPQAASDVRS